MSWCLEIDQLLCITTFLTNAKDFYIILGQCCLQCCMIDNDVIIRLYTDSSTVGMDEFDSVIGVGLSVYLHMPMHVSSLMCEPMKNTNKFV